MEGYPDKVELLAPAGSREAFIGAVNAGADAVYLGGERFGARAYADNFSDQEIVRAIEEAHIFGRKVYLTANILTRETELKELVDFVSRMYSAGLDGVIVQDLGVLDALGWACPGLPLHASTQLSVTSSESVQFLRRLGVTRVVPARELSLKEIEQLRREDAAVNGKPIEIESFIHGAMCYSYSGRCLMSSFLGGRSGNRGRCAGTCRLPARILDEQGRPVGPDARKKEVYPLSMKDMCVLQILPELIDAGICSFKIEGRMKKPVYAAGVTAIYRKYIDRCYAWTREGRKTPWAVEEKDLEKLRSLYIRTSLGTGYYHKRNGRELVTIGKPGYAGTDAALEEEISSTYLSGFPRVEIKGRAVFRTDRPAELHVTAQRPGKGEVTASVTGAVVQKATGRPLEKNDLDSRLRRTGDSLFVFSALDIAADESIFLPVSAVNSLRREALSCLKDGLAEREKGTGAQDREASRESAAENLQDAASPEESAAEKLQDAASHEAGAAENPQNASAPDLPCREPGCGSRESASLRAGGNGKNHTGAGDSPSGQTERVLWALVSDPEQLKAALEAQCSAVLIDGDFGPGNVNFIKNKTHSGNNSDLQSQKTRLICVLPPVFRVYEREKIRRMIAEAEQKGFSGIMVRTLEELEMAGQMHYRGEIIADASLYTWNRRSMDLIAEHADRIVFSLELNQADIRQAVTAFWDSRDGKDGISVRETGTGRGHQGAASVRETGTHNYDRFVLPVYGRIPMMETAGCIRRTENLCSRQDGFWYLEDRMGKRLPVRCRCGTCSNTVYNAVPLSLHQFAGRGLMAQVPVCLCMFTTETGRQTRSILEFFASPGILGLQTDKINMDHMLSGENTGRAEEKSRDRRPSDKSNGRAKEKNHKRGARKEPALIPPFTEFTNGHFKSGAI